MDNPVGSLPAKATDPLTGGVWGPWPTVGFGLVILVVSLFVQFLTAIVFGLLWAASDGALNFAQLEEAFPAIEGLVVSVAMFVDTPVSIGLIAVFIKVRGGLPVAEYLGLKRISKKTVFVVLAVTAAFIAASGAVAVILQQPGSEFMTDIYSSSVFPPLLWLAVIVFAPASEEALFRGFLFEGLRRSRIGLAGAIVLPAAVWSLFHFQYGLYEIVTIFFLGVLFGIVRFKTGSLWSVLLMHAFGNLIAMLAVALNVNI